MESKRNLPSNEELAKTKRTIEFESRLAKIIIENPSIYKDAVEKVNKALIHFFRDTTKHEFAYNYPIKKIYHMTNLEFLNHVYQYEPQGYVLDKRLKEIVADPFPLLSDFSKFDVTLTMHFWKHFFDDVFQHSKNFKFNAIDLVESKASKVPSLKELTQFLLSSDLDQVAKLLATLRNPEFFDNTNRGRIEVKASETTTQDLGLFPHGETPEDLKNYFKSPIHPAKLQFVPDSKASIVVKMGLFNRSFIAGASGTLSYFLLSMSRLLVLNEEEIRKLNTFLAGVMVAEGNHSFYEIALIAREAQFWRHKDEYLYPTFLTPKLFELPETLELLDKFKEFKQICLTAPEELEENPLLKVSFRKI